VEETFVYPLLRAKVEGGGELADRSIHEHQDVKRLLSDIEKIDATKAESSRKMDELSAEVRRHVAE
jgi:hypothetical protein